MCRDLGGLGMGDAYIESCMGWGVAGSGGGAVGWTCGDMQPSLVASAILDVGRPVYDAVIDHSKLLATPDQITYRTEKARTSTHSHPGHPKTRFTTLLWVSL